MDNYQKVEQLVNKAGCSYEDAKAALEACEWDMLDAVISLEREGKVNKEAEQTAQAAEEAAEVVSEVTVETISDNSPKIACSYDDSREESSQRTEDSPKRRTGLWARIRSFLTKNRMVVLRKNGQTIMDLPIWIPVIALIAFFWAVLIIAVIAMVLGCRFHFEGEDLGKTGINSTMDKATDYAEKVKNDLAGKVNDKQNTDY